MDDGTKTNEKYKAGGHFVMVPSWIFTYGYWARMSGVQKAVLGVIARKADNVTHVCRPSRETIAKEAGVAKKSISSITHELSVMDVIKKWRRWSHVCYEVKFFPPPWLAESGQNWDVKTKSPKKSATYPRDPGLGEFIPKNTVTPIP